MNENKTLEDYMNDLSWQRVNYITFEGMNLSFNPPEYGFIPIYRNTDLTIIVFSNNIKMRYTLLNPRNVMVSYYDEQDK